MYALPRYSPIGKDRPGGVREALPISGGRGGVVLGFRGVQQTFTLGLIY